MATAATTNPERGRGYARQAAVALVLIGFVVAAALAGIGLMRGTVAPDVRSVAARRQAAPPATALPATAPPPVLPTVFADLTPDEARTSNALMAFAPGKPPLAARFVYAGTPLDRGAALTCLAAAVLYEAGDDAPGEQAVAQVVLNRLRHPAFPKTVCGVVFQGSERPTGCQFTFTCDGALDRPPSVEGWRRAKEIADAALSGHVDAAVGTATHYHTDWVVPYWRDSLVKLAKVHTQIFYRWPGGWGLPAAFGGRPQPDERLDPRLVPLAGPEQAAAMQTVASGEAASVPVPEDSTGILPLPEEVHLAGVPHTALHGAIVRLADPVAGQYVVQFDRDAYPGSFAVTSLALCRNVPDCMVFGWLNPAQMPRRLPFVPNGVQSMSFMFRRSSLVGREQALWNCRQVPRDNPAQCLPGTR